MKPLHQVQTSLASNVQSPSVAQKVSRMGVPTPFAGATAAVPSPIRYPTVTSGARPEYIQLTAAQQQAVLQQQQQQQQRPYEPHDMSKSYSPGTMYGQATSPGRRYMSDGELLDSVGIPVTSGVEISTWAQRTYYVWKDPPQMAGYNSYPADNSSSPIRHASYASQVGYFLQQQQQQQHIQLQSGGPRTTPSGYPGGPVVPSGNMSSPTATTSAAAVAAVAVSSHHPMVPTMVGYTTTGRPSTHQQQPMSFTRALEMTENLDQRGRPQSQQPSVGVPVNQGPPQPSSQPLDPQSASNEDSRRDSVYDMNSYEISV